VRLVTIAASDDRLDELGVFTVSRHEGELRAHVATLLASHVPLAAEQTRDALAESFEVREFRPREQLLAQGGDWDMELIIDGWVAVRRVGRTGRRFTIAVLGPGQLAGASAAARSPALGENVALTTVTAVIWPGSEVRRLVAADGGLALDFIDRIVLGIGTILDRYDTVTFEGARARLCKVLLDHRDIAFGPFRPILSRGELTSLVGSSREMTNRILRQLEAEGALRRLGGRGLELIDETKLRLPPADSPSRGRRGAVV
jgi:CRP-like cAMP-binding protein